MEEKRLVRNQRDDLIVGTVHTFLLSLQKVVQYLHLGSSLSSVSSQSALLLQGKDICSIPHSHSTCPHTTFSHSTCFHTTFSYSTFHILSFYMFHTTFSYCTTHHTPHTLMSHAPILITTCFHTPIPHVQQPYTSPPLL